MNSAIRKIDKPPLEPDACIDISWALTFLFSDDQRKQKFGDEIKTRLENLMDSHKDSTAHQYMVNITNSIYDTIRVIDYRTTGMTQYVTVNRAIEKNRIEELQNLAGISSKAVSFVPRVVSTLGGASAIEIYKQVTNYAIPSIGPLSGFEVFVVGATIGYGLMEIFLRLYTMYKIPKILSETQNQIHVVWNKFLRESRESLRNLLINTIRQREIFFPDLKTYDGKQFFTIEKDSRSEDEINELDEVLNSILDLKGPQVRNDILLSRRIAIKDWKKNSFVIRIRKGDKIRGSFSVSQQKLINFRYYEQNDYNSDLMYDEPKYLKEHVFADEFDIISRTDGHGILYFENTSRLRTKAVSFSCQITRDLIKKFGV